jgi:hypothetical protein
LRQWFVIGVVTQSLTYLPAPQVPLLLGHALSTAAQHSWDSPAALVALQLIGTLVRTAEASGVIKDAAAAGSLATSIRQQLQQAGVLQQLTAVMAALAADMRSQAALIRGWSVDELCSNLLNCSTTMGSVSRLALVGFASVYGSLRRLWCSPTRADAADSMSWLCDPSGHAEAAMQLSTAALQHVSSVLQHAVPALHQRRHEKAAVLLQEQQARISTVTELGYSVMSDLYTTWLADGLQQQVGAATIAAQAQQQQRQQQQQLQRLLLSPHCLPSITSLLVLHASWANRCCSLQAACSTKGQGATSAGSSRDSQGRSSSSSSVRDSGSGLRQHGHHQRGVSAAAAVGGGSSSSSSSGAVCSDAPTTCQLQLLELLCLAPELAATAERRPSLPQVLPRLNAITSLLATHHNAVKGLFNSSPVQQDALDRELAGDQQRWHAEQQLLLLLPTVMLPCASNMMLLPSASTPDDPWSNRVICASGLLRQSNQVLLASTALQIWLEQPATGHRLPHPAWMGEVLDEVLLLAERLQQQQQQHELQGQAAAQRSSSTPAAPSMGPSTSSIPAWRSEMLPTSARHWWEMLTALMYESSNWCLSGGSTASPHPQTSSDGSGAAADRTEPQPEAAAHAVPAVAERFVEVCTCWEAGLRMVIAASQSGTIHTPPTLVTWCVQRLLLVPGCVEGARVPLSMHIGLRGPAALVLEQRQVYSVFSCIQKLGRCRAGVGQQLCWGQQVAEHCCWEAAVSALRLLHAAAPSATSGAAATAAATAAAVPAAADEQGRDPPAAVVQLPEVEYLPSLVIFGRSCLVWAEQLEQQAPELLLLLASGAAVAPPQQQEDEEDEGEGGVRAEHSAACMCIPGLREGAAAVTAEACALEQLVATVSSWVGGVTSHAARTTLAAAAGGDLQQFTQQLELLSAAQHAVRQAGVGDAALAALVQQLQATGVVLSSIAVPHFCNNPACVNISGATEVQLVSGRSCICAGCRTARYCGRVCQRQAWPQHKAVCKALAAAVDFQL